jgi:AcrR family transcriptional regulator
LTDTTRPGGKDDSKRETIVAAAAEVFASRGFAGASNRHIARAANISPGLIYWYFEDKNELFKAVVERLFPLTALAIPDSVDELPLDQLLRGIGTQFLALMGGDNVVNLIRLALSELLRFPEIRQKLGAMISQQAVTPLARQLDLRVARGEIPALDTRLAAQAFFGSLVGYVLRKYIFESSDLADTEDQSMIDTVVEIYSTGLLRGNVPPGDEGATL